MGAPRRPVWGAVGLEPARGELWGLGLDPEDCGVGTPS